MSTRRARIKAVTSLPPRRKNNDGAEKAKPKILEKEDIEKVRSPKTPRGSVKTQDNLEKKSPKPASPLVSPRSINNVSEKIPSPKITTASPLKSPHTISNIKQKTGEVGPSTTNMTKKVATPKSSEKVSVITSIFNAKPNVFASPRSYSPVRKHVASPLARQTSNVEVSIQRLTPITPEKAPDKSKENIMGIDKIDGKSKELCKGANTSIATEVTRGDISDDYNVPSVPESITEDTVMDGIVPLQPVSNAPKPLALLKNEIISENAEVLFDPIVPLPSPSKVRTKLRPVPRLAPLRRNSVQGSASESEDENRRALLSGGGSSTPAPSRQRHDSHTSHSTMLSLPNREVSRIRNDSICSSVSQATAVPLAAASPVKDKHLSKSRRLDMSRRMAAMRRRRETVKRDALTMYDLIFYNPTSNPIIPDQDEINAKEANEKEEAVRKASKETEVVTKQQPEADAAPVPQIKLGPNGEIMLDEQSLVIKPSETRKVSSNVVHEGAWGTASSGRYRRTPRTADWSDAETVRFYRALAALGTDFMLMERLFPGRTRRDLKLKFKKEERLNMAQVDKALRTTSRWDATKLLEEFEAEREAAERRVRAEAEQLREHARELRQRQKEVKESRVRQSRGAKALGCSVLPASVQSKIDSTCSADELIRRHHEAKARKRKVKLPASSPPQPKTSTAQSTSTSQFATLTLTSKTSTTQERRVKNTNPDMATILKLDPTKSQGKTPDLKQTPTQVPVVPSNIETGSLVVLTVDDPNSPTKKMLQTYIANGGGQLTPIALPASFLNSVVTYMKKGEKTPKSISAGSSPHLTSPCSVASQDSRPSSTPGVIQLTGASPAKRQRHSSYTITQL